MCKTPLRRFASFLLLVVAACHTAEPAPLLPPMPMGEVAQPVAQEAWSDVYPLEKVDLDWVDAGGARYRIVFRIGYRTRVAQELLAAECVRTNWTVAVERAQRVCEKADFHSESGLLQCERDLQQQLSEALFPCESGATLATVSKIVWVKRLFD